MDPDCRLRFNESEKAAVYREAQHRARHKRGTRVDTSLSKADAAVLNAVGIICEVAWARWFAVPWYQNPGARGDHHRFGDLRLRSGIWAEVKGARDPNRILLPSSTGEKWSVLCATWWDKSQNTAVMHGVLEHHQIGELATVKERGAVNGQTLRVLEIDTNRFLSSVLMMERSVCLPRPKAERGLRCPWCIAAEWPCADPTCVQALEAREAIRGISRREFWERQRQRFPWLRARSQP